MKKRILLYLIFLHLQNISGQCLFKEVTTLNATSFGISLDNKLYGWGSTEFYDLDIVSMMQTDVTQIGSDENWAKVDGGNLHALLLKTDGTLWGVGQNTNGQLGDNSTINRPLPIQIGTDTNWSAISAGVNFSLALKDDGTLWAWGNNQNGQLGIGTNVSQIVPTQVGNQSNWAKINAAKSNMSFAIKNDGTLWAWGSNYNGQLGLGNYTNTSIPLQVGLDNDWFDISSGLIHTIALKTDRSLWAWGSNNYGELGNNTTINSIVPIQVGDQNDWQSVNANYIGSKAIKVNGTMWCWGNNTGGQLGDGTFVNRLIPTQLGQDTDWSDVYSGQGHVLAVKTNSQIYGWGGNNFGQLATGDTTTLTSPYQIGCSNLNNADYVIKHSSLEVYPNPTNDSFYISNNHNTAKVELYDLYGRKINSWPNKQQLYTLPNIEDGVYSLLIYSNQDVFVKKIIKGN